MFGRKKRLYAYVEPMSRKELLRCFVGAEHSNVLKGVRAVLKGLEEMMKENAATPGISDADRAGYCGGMGAMIDAQNYLTEVVSAAKKSGAIKGEEDG